MKQHNSRAFTLLELLVVIGIIGVLLAIMIPVLAKAQDAASTTACLTNLRQLGAAVMTYAHDNQGSICPSLAWEPGSGSNPYNSAYANYATLLHDGNYIPSRDQKDPNGQSSNDDSAFRCPGAQAQRAMTLPQDASGSADGNFKVASQRDRTGSLFWRARSPRTGHVVDTWYGANGAYLGSVRDKYPMRAFAPSDYTSSNPSYRTPHRLIDLKQNSGWVLLYDGLFVHNEKAERITLRHRRESAANLVFADGHAETVDVNELPKCPEGLKPTTTPVATASRFYWRLD